MVQFANPDIALHHFQLVFNCIALSLFSAKLALFFFLSRDISRFSLIVSSISLYCACIYLYVCLVIHCVITDDCIIRYPAFKLTSVKP